MPLTIRLMKMKKHLSNLQKTEYRYFIQLISAIANSEKPPLPQENIDFDRLLFIAKKANLVAMFADAILLVSQEYKIDDDFLKKINELKNKEIFVDTHFIYEGKKILNEFEKNQIKNLPLKGWFMKNYYPQTYYRSVSDFDILFDEKDIDKLKIAFENIGYSFLKKDDNQYHFVKKPLMYVEMHSALVHKSEENYNELKNQLEKSLKNADYQFSYCMSKEDYYVYMIVHSAYHFKVCGMGLRMVLDSYIFMKNFKNELDMTYLRNRLKKCGVLNFANNLEKISEKWFSKNSNLEKFSDIEEYILLCNALGRLEISVMYSMEKNNKNKQKSKFSLLLGSIFPNIDYMKNSYNFLEKYPFLLPYSWVCMWFKRFFILKNVRIKTGFKNRFYSNDDLIFYNLVVNKMFKK